MSSTDQRAELAAANQILVKHGVLDAYGHVSVRDESDKGKFLLARNVAPARVTPEDIQQFSLDGETSDVRASYLERYIHSEIYRARPNVESVVHSHAPAVLPFAVVTTPLRAVSHMAGFLVSGVPNFEIRDIAGNNSDLLIRNARLGQALADCLGNASVCLMRGHGAIVVGVSLAQAVHRSVFTVLNARTQSAAANLGGDIIYLTDEEGQSAAESNNTQVQRAWELWLSEVKTDVK